MREESNTGIFVTQNRSIQFLYNETFLPIKLTQISWTSKNWFIIDGDHHYTKSAHSDFYDDVK